VKAVYTGHATIPAFFHTGPASALPDPLLGHRLPTLLASVDLLRAYPPGEHHHQAEQKPTLPRSDWLRPAICAHADPSGPSRNGPFHSSSRHGCGFPSRTPLLFPGFWTMELSPFWCPQYPVFNCRRVTEDTLGPILLGILWFASIANRAALILIWDVVTTVIVGPGSAVSDALLL